MVRPQGISFGTASCGSGRRSRTLTTRVRVSRPLAESFAFFADATNLDRLTPPWLRFRIVTPTPIDMRAGALIDYKLKIHGLPISWRTAITVWEPPLRFVDEQVRGPYTRWIHEHRFEAHGPDATVILDRVDYRAPGGLAEPLLHGLLVRRDLERIFTYRVERIREILGDDLVMRQP